MDLQGALWVDQKEIGLEPEKLFPSWNRRTIGRPWSEQWTMTSLCMCHFPQVVYLHCSLCNALHGWWCILDCNVSAQNWWKHGLVCKMAPRSQASWTKPVQEQELVWWERDFSDCLLIVHMIQTVANEVKKLRAHICLHLCWLWSSLFFLACLICVLTRWCNIPASVRLWSTPALEAMQCCVHKIWMGQRWNCVMPHLSLLPLTSAPVVSDEMEPQPPKFELKVFW